MRTDELYKFSDEMLISVRTVPYDIASNLRMDYLPKRRWSNLDKQRSRIMIKAIETPKLLSSIEDSHRGPSDVMHDPSQPLKVSQKTLVSFLTEITLTSIDFLTPN
nr:hypothetical protein [Tanacetum cinerariifolium]